MYPDSCMDKEDLVHIYNRILLSHKKEQNDVTCSNKDGPGDCHTEWSKSDTERHISCDITYMWNLKKWCKWTYLQNITGDTNVEKKFSYDHQGGKAGGGIN